jgi:predicted metal-dependent hydrolase
MMIAIWVVLLVVSMVCIYTTKEPSNFTQLKQKYLKFIQTVPHEFRVLKKRSLITGTSRKGDLGSNVNKGYEISICLDNDVNSMFHVLLHELAHCTVNEYDHSDKFWANFEKLKQHAVQTGAYALIPEGTEFCGKKIKD